MSDNFWSRVLELIEWKGISRKEFSHNVGVSYSSIHNGAERGSIPSADLALKIADELNTSIEFLVYGNQKNNSNKNLKPANASEKKLSHKKSGNIFIPEKQGYYRSFRNFALPAKAVNPRHDFKIKESHKIKFFFFGRFLPFTTAHQAMDGVLATWSFAKQNSNPLKIARRLFLRAGRALRGSAVRSIRPHCHFRA